MFLSLNGGTMHIAYRSIESFRHDVSGVMVVQAISGTEYHTSKTFTVEEFKAIVDKIKTRMAIFESLED